MLVQILVDNPRSWIVSYANDLVSKIINDLGVNAKLIHDPENVIEGDILCLLGCERIFNKLHLNKHNLVVHESDLPSGKGWSPVSWQVLENKKNITVSLFEAVNEIDAGPIYAQSSIVLEGSELWSEIKDKQGRCTQKLVLDFVTNYPNNKSRDQIGEPSYYSKRTIKDSELNINKSIADQFNLLRIVDNDRYPAFFFIDGIKYIIKIYKGD